MNRILLTICGGLLLTGVAVAQDATAPSPTPQAQDQQIPAPDAQPAPEQDPPAPQPQAQPTPGQKQAASPSPASGSPKIAPGSVIPVQLAKGLDAKKAKTGDEVVARVTQDMKTNSGEVIVPKDTKMIGHVTEAQAHSKEQKQSQLGISFDHAVMKDGTSMPLPMSIQAIIAQTSSNPGASETEQGPPVPQGTSNGMGQTPRASVPAGAMPTADSNAPSETQGRTAARPQITGQTQGVVGISDLNLSPTPDPTMGSVVRSDKNNVKLESGLLLLLRVNQ